MTRRNSSGVISHTGENTVTIASLIQTSIGPKVSAMRSAAANTASASATSAGTARAVPPELFDFAPDLVERLGIARDQADAPAGPGEAMHDGAPRRRPKRR